MSKKLGLFYLLLLSFLIATLANSSVLSAEIAEIYVESPITYEEMDESFSIDLKIREVADLYSWQVNMTFNPSVLEFVNVTEGDFLKDQPEGTSSAIREDHKQDGWVFFGWATIGQYAGVTGYGTLATVQFAVKAISESAINMSNPNTKLIKINPPPVPPGGSMYEPISYTTESGFFINLMDPPKAEFTFSPSLPSLNEEVTFNASNSSASAPRVIDSYQWDFGDGTTKTYVKDVNLTSTTTHTYTTSGDFIVSLMVTDNATATSLMQALFETTTVPQLWYELYSTKTAPINIKFGHDVAITSVTASPSEVTVGQTVTINVFVLNKGVETESFSVTAYYGNNVIETKQVTDLSPDGTQTLTFEWDTTDVSAGDYQIKAEASLEGDGYPDDNSYLDGTVTVNTAGEPFPVLIVGVVVAVVVIAIVAFWFMRRK